MVNAAIHYFPEAFTTSGAKLMGRHAAGESFIRGFFRYSRATDVWIHVDKKSFGKQFHGRMQEYGCAKPLRVVDKASLQLLAEPGMLFCPGPGLEANAWQRTYYAPNAWSLCGITHTISTMGAMDSLAGLLTAPTQPWDAVICTSTEAKKMVQRLWGAQASYLQQRFKIQQLVLPELPVMPLGIHTEDFTFSDADKAEARKHIGADDKTIVVLFAGRLSFHAKAHPLAMYQALENAAKQLPSGHKLMLVEFGMHANDYIRDAFKEAAAAACPSVHVMTLHGGVTENFKYAWASADIFCSFSDNFQETFGITPIEAMAAGLPVVVSDWDGYKDTVRDGVDGFRIPTSMPQEGVGKVLTQRYALEIDNYDQYCGYTSSLVAVNVEAAAEAFVKLIKSPSLRKKMGKAGRERALSTYDWANIIPQYEALWAEQERIRKAYKPEEPLLKHPWPARMSPLSAFASYPTETMELDTVLRASDSDAVARFHTLKALEMVSYINTILAPDEAFEEMLKQCVQGDKTVRQLLEMFPQGIVQRIYISIAVLCKLGLLGIVKK